VEEAPQKKNSLPSKKAPDLPRRRDRSCRQDHGRKGHGVESPVIYLVFVRNYEPVVDEGKTEGHHPVDEPEISMVDLPPQEKEPDGNGA